MMLQNLFSLRLSIMLYSCTHPWLHIFFLLLLLFYSIFYSTMHINSGASHRKIPPSPGQLSHLPPNQRISLESDATWCTNKPTGYSELSPRGNLSPTRRRRGEITNSLLSSSPGPGTCLQSRLCPQSVYITVLLLWLQFSGPVQEQVNSR